MYRKAGSILRDCGRRGVSALLALCLLPLVLATPAGAQTRSEINQKIEALEKQLNAVQRRVFQGDSTYFEPSKTSPGTVTAVVPEDNPPDGARGVLLADMSARLGELERQLRMLTGQVEEMQFEQRRLADRLGRFEQDVGLRLQALESGNGGTLQPLADEGGGVAGEFSAAPSGLRPVRTPEEAAALLGAPGATPAAPKSAQEVYDAANALLRRGQYAEAEAGFRDFLARFGDHELAGNAQYWLGETYYVRKDYPRAAQAFLTGYQDYGAGSKAPDSLLKLGMTLAALDQKDDACAAFEELGRLYPNAEERIRRLAGQERTRLGCR